jgi:cyclic pyranopterin phosphate synthase
MKDSYGREITYLRISVTELCDLRCRYCMPEDGVCKKAHEEMLTLEETELAVKAAASLGIKKIRITGGEPLVRGDFEEIVKVLSGYGIDIVRRNAERILDVVRLPD